jgi:hypothetical protein
LNFIAGGKMGDGEQCGILPYRRRQNFSAEGDARRSRWPLHAAPIPRQYHASSRFFANVDSMAADFSGTESVKIGVLHQLLEISTCPWPIKTEKFGRMAS